MRRDFKVVAVGETAEETEQNIAVAWHSMITDGRLMPGLVDIRRLNDRLMVLTFTWSIDDGAVWVDRDPPIPSTVEAEPYAPTDGGNRPEHSVGAGPRRKLPSLRGAVRS